MTQTTRIAFAILGFLAFGQIASAQVRAVEEPSDSIEIMTGVMDYDLQGVGQTVPFTLRVTKGLTQRLSLEFGATVARPSETFGRTTFATPEVRAVYAWRLGRVSPFVAGGGGFSVRRSAFPLIQDKWQSTLTAGGGARFHFNERAYGIGEMRLRGITKQFAASTAEWLGGLGFVF